ncbi:MAG: hypothetical protein JWL62_3482 [Hyphomicrobiales bacterium]|nr:hypothetical protein [Hyphomicrobiales bacterium]
MCNRLLCRERFDPTVVTESCYGMFSMQWLRSFGNSVAGGVTMKLMVAPFRLTRYVGGADPVGRAAG